MVSIDVFCVCQASADDSLKGESAFAGQQTERPSVQLRRLRECLLFYGLHGFCALVY